MQVLIREFDIKFVDLIKKKNPRRKQSNWILNWSKCLKKEGWRKECSLGNFEIAERGTYNWNKNVSLNNTLFLIQEISRLIMRRYILTSNYRKL